MLCPSTYPEAPRRPHSSNMGSTPRRSKLDVASYSPSLEVHCKALLFLSHTMPRDAISLIHPAGVWVDARLSFAFCAYRPTLNAYCGRTQSVRVSRSSSLTG